MPDQVQLRGGTAAENDGFTGVNREVTVDTTNKTLRVHDGVAAGGSKLAAYDAWGRLQVADPVDNSDVVNKGFMDTAIAGSQVESVTIVDSKGSTTNGGTFTSGEWRTRDLNTIRDVANKPDWVSLAANVLTIQPGIYDVGWSAPAGVVDRHATRLHRTSGTAAVLLTGSRERAPSTNSWYTRSMGAGRLTLSAAADIELQHRCQTTRADDGFGSGDSALGLAPDVDGAENVFSMVTITRIGDAP